MDETGLLVGSIETQPIYGIGLLVIPNPRQLTDALYKVHFNLNARKSHLRTPSAGKSATAVDARLFRNLMH